MTIHIHGNPDAEQANDADPAECDVSFQEQGELDGCVARHTTDLGDGSIIYSQMLSGCTSFTETFNHCESQITKRLSMGLHKFYIGITGDPQFRWENPRFGHTLKHRGAHMHVLLKASADITRDVEISLVRHYHANIGTSFKILNAKNSPPGSLRENAHGEHFLYVIW